MEILEKDQDKNDDKKQNQDNAYIVLTLSGFTCDFGSSWHAKARENCKRIKDPYVRAMINFLTVQYNEHRNVFYLVFYDITFLRKVNLADKIQKFHLRLLGTSNPSAGINDSSNFSERKPPAI